MGVTPPLIEANRVWAGCPLRERLHVVRRFRGLLAEKADWIAKDIAEASASRLSGSVGMAEVLTSEVLPLCEAAKFLEREAGYWLKPQRLGWRGRPAWLFGVSSEIRREPVGTVLIIAAGNYPLFLAGVQALQALTAGNAVVLKPGQGGTLAATWLADLLREAGLPAGLLTITGEGVADATAAMDAGVDKVFLTGSASSGRAVLAKCAETLTPACVELSGCDAVFVLPPEEGGDDSHVALAARGVAFGLRLNGSQTCIAPRRVFVDARVADVFVSRLRREVDAYGPVRVDPVEMKRAAELVDAAEASSVDSETGASVSGAERVCGAWEYGDKRAEPYVLDRVGPGVELLRTDVFAPVVSVVRVGPPFGATLEESLLGLASLSPYALGASVYGPRKAAEALAKQVDAGSVCVNDLIVPTADPRLPFGGRGDSGFGVTRGAEGLLEMTRAKTVSVRKLNQHPHYDPAGEEDAEAFAAYVRVTHGPSVASRLASVPGLVRGLKALSKKPGAEQGNKHDREQHEP
ncbi:MAG: aldehyde dehydrogenase family protein [Planctomycetota bacterium]